MTLSRSILVLLVCGPSLLAAQPAELSIETTSLADAQHPFSVVEWPDHVFKGTRRYSGYWLSDVIARIPGSRSINPREMFIIFRSKDGYDPLLDMDKVAARKGFLALSNTPSGQGWLKAGPREIYPGPAYLIWEAPGEHEESSGYPWPYQMVKIELVPKAPMLKILRPDGLADKEEGAVLFQEHCLKCHGVGHFGGTMGPALDVVLSVTGSWKSDFMASFIKDPRAVVPASKMPPMNALSTNSTSRIVDYLKFLSAATRGHKLMP